MLQAVGPLLKKAKKKKRITDVLNKERKCIHIKYSIKTAKKTEQRTKNSNVEQG